MTTPCGHYVDVTIDDVADQLYGLPPDDFTAARDQAAKAADGDERRAIKSLRKPTAAAHAVNRLARDQPDALDRLVRLGDDLREAMAGDPDEVRRLSEERRAVISALVDASLPAAVQQDVTATLEAATADPELGAAVRSGRLVKPLRYAGFGTAADVGDAVALPPRREQRTTTKPGKTTTGPKPTGKAPAKTAAKPAARSATTSAPRPSERERDLVALREHVLELSGAADDAQQRYDAASKRVVAARQALDAAEKERAEAHKAARAAHAAAERARRELGRLERS